MSRLDDPLEKNMFGDRDSISKEVYDSIKTEREDVENSYRQSETEYQY